MYSFNHLTHRAPYFRKVKIYQEPESSEKLEPVEKLETNIREKFVQRRQKKSTTLNDSMEHGITECFELRKKNLATNLG